MDLRYIRVNPLPTIGKEEIRYILSNLLSGKNSHEHDDVSDFERTFRDYIGSKYAFAFGKGRMALYAILKSLEVKKNDEIILPAYTCFVVPNALKYLGVKPIYVDIDWHTYSMDPEDIRRKITPRTVAIIPHHLFGLPADMETIAETAEDHGIYVIEDSAQALGAKYKSKKTGNIGDAAFFSFDYTKVITTGQGGIATTNSPEIAEKLRIVQEECSQPPKKYVQLILLDLLRLSYLLDPSFPLGGQGINYILNHTFFRELATTRDEYLCIKPSNYPFGLANALARIGLLQLRKLDKLNERRIKIAKHYNEVLSELGLQPVYIPPYSKHIFLRYAIRIRNRERFRKILHRFHIILDSCWFDYVVHPDPKFQSLLGYEQGSCPIAEVTAETVVNIPCHPKMTNKDVERVVMAQRQFCLRFKDDVIG
jgi:dTDP-4-amino-4,6-dideoxygalactose transaminase